MDIQLLASIATAGGRHQRPSLAMTKNAYRLVYRPEPDRLPRWVARLLLWF